MAGKRPPTLVGFENVDAVNSLMEQVGLTADLGAFLSDHLLDVLRQQYSDLNIESVEFMRAGNCNADGVSWNPGTVKLNSLSLPIDVKLVVTAANERYSLQVHVVVNAKLQGDKYEFQSDVMVKDQTFLGVL